ncbi:MAG TPA: carboxylase [Myxococcota bacterium]|nr:carboxylase [Myxococcota bacterium]HNZ02902.1 carboxylase [Myxococcota bacterium]HPB50451.1 carboxylase [Myxococcota bacterium]HQP95723.1 carboxylase [Myxococcota bacterium]
MSGKLLIRDLTLRDGQQSQFATRMNQSQVDRVLPFYKDAGFFAMEIWGGAVPDSVMRYLNEDPWDRLESIKAGIGDASKLAALSRGRNLFGYNPYPDTVIEGFCRNAIQSGIGIMRIFDALNDIDNMRSSIRFVKENGGMADCAVCYTVDPKFTTGERFKAFMRGKRLPRNVFGVDYFVKKAVELEKAGADMISVKDMAGLVDPETAGRLIPALKKAVRIPINMHTHCTPGFGVATCLMAMISGVDIIDTVALPFSGGPAAPAWEIIELFARKLGIETGVNPEAVSRINQQLRVFRQELAEFDQFKRPPREFDIASETLPDDIDALFDSAIEAAQAFKIKRLLDVCHRIEEWFNYPPSNDIVRVAQIPGGMYTNMLAQMKTANLSNYMREVLKTVPSVRLAAGLPPLVTPTSQIVGVQAVMCVINKHKGRPVWENPSSQFVNLVKGSYGHTPIPVSPDFRQQLAGVRDEVPYDTSAYKKQENPQIAEFGGVTLAQNDKEELLLELFPNVAGPFLKGLRKADFEAAQARQAAEAAMIHAPLYDALSGNYLA